MVGGGDESFKPLSAIHKYNPTFNSWDLTSIMPTARWISLVAILPTNEMMIVGGCIKLMGGRIDTIEIANFSLS